MICMWYLAYFKVVSNFTCLTAREITYNNVEISCMHLWYLCQIWLQIMLLSILIIIQQNWSNPKYTCMKEMVFHFKLMEKAFFIFKMTDPASVQPASSDFRKHPETDTSENDTWCLSKSNSPSLPFKPHYKEWVERIW